MRDDGELREGLAHELHHGDCVLDLDGMVEYGGRVSDAEDGFGCAGGDGVGAWFA